MAHPHWPLFDLRITTPRVELRYPDDDLLAQVVSLAAQGVHDPEYMPFSIPWTDEPSPRLERGGLQFMWRARADLQPDNWQLPFAVLVDGEVAGVQDIGAKQFPIRRTVETGSWLGVRFQGQGIGKEMRAAVLHLGFAGLHAEYAHTAAWHDNAASLGVTRSLGYEPNGEVVEVRRATAPVTQLRYRMTRAMWETRRRDDIVLAGLERCLPLLGLDE